jgi:hypothetical protein
MGVNHGGFSDKFHAGFDAHKGRMPPPACIMIRLELIEPYLVVVASPSTGGVADALGLGP